MNFWDWPRETFFSNCTFNVVLGTSASLFFAVMVPATLIKLIKDI